LQGNGKVETHQVGEVIRQNENREMKKKFHRGPVPQEEFDGTGKPLCKGGADIPDSGFLVYEGHGVIPFTI
jgi:hypothetical protein